jgi:hypothetical protein
MAWVADLVNVANNKLMDRNGAIGPSFFMRKDLDEQRLALVWQHEILPYLEDYYFDAPERVGEFELAKLRKELTAASLQPAGADGTPVSVDGAGTPADLTAGEPMDLVAEEGDAAAEPA